MKLDEVKKRVDGIPHMGIVEADIITDFILKNNFKNILELGFRHGVSTCYMAAALDELNMNGHITTIDLANAKEASPNIDELLNDLNLYKYVTVFYEPSGYIWRLMKMLEKDNNPRFDFCYLDGAHDWATDGFAFFLVDKFLKPGGWIIFDDIDWSFERSPALKDTEFVKKMSPEERSTHQVRKVYELLVKTHPNYESFKVDGSWAYVQKKTTTSSSNKVEIKKEIIYKDKYVGLGGALLRIGKKIFNK